MYVFDMFTQLFSIALLDVISGLSVHESSTQIRHIIRYLSTAMNLCHFDADDDCDDDEIRKPMKHWQWHQTMWCSNQPHDQFILHCELQARTILCIRMLQQIIKYVFGMFSQWFLIALLDVISGLRIRDQIKHNQIHYCIGTQK